MVTFDMQPINRNEWAKKKIEDSKRDKERYLIGGRVKRRSRGVFRVWGYVGLGFETEERGKRERGLQISEEIAHGFYMQESFRRLFFKGKWQISPWILVQLQIKTHCKKNLKKGLTFRNITNG